MLQRLLTGLEARKTGDEWRARCPAHDGRSDHSLSISEKDGLVLIKCFGGCQQSDVIAKLRAMNLWPDPESNGSLPPGVFPRLGNSVYVDHWTYRDVADRVIGHVVRYQTEAGEKEIRPYFKQEAGTWKQGAAPKPRPLYGLWKLERKPKAPIIICEGEKACDAAQRLFPTHMCLTSPGGASAAKTADWGPLAGRKVTIWPDNDEPGHKYARDVVSELHRVGIDIQGIVDVAALGMGHKEDLADWPVGKALPEPVPILNVENFSDQSKQSDKARETSRGTDRPQNRSGDQSKDQGEPDDSAEWQLASEILPRVEFPWEILPAQISDSLQQLARSCASSPTSLPGCTFAITGSVVGRLLSTSPKMGWEEPSIIWGADIRPSGSGKTPAANLLMKPIHRIQADAHRKWQASVEAWKGSHRKDREGQQEPEKCRAWFVSDLTLEGLREDLENHPTGGIMVMQEELSSFVSGQNQYKAKGNDRESWLALFDGNDARIKRVGRNIMLTGGRVNIFGGIQPAVFRAVFGSNGGLYLADGTAFRFLYTYESDHHFDLDGCAWDVDHSKRWTDYIQQSIWWTEQQEQPHIMLLNSGAQERFFNWRNRLNAQRDLLPESFRGFIPKAVGYALRLSGIIHFLHRVTSGKAPDTTLSIEDIERGITTVEFYLGQAVDAMRLIRDFEHKPDVVADPRMKVLVETLLALQYQVDNGRLSVSHVRDEFNKRIDPPRKFSEKRQSKAFGLFLRKLGLTVSESLMDYREQRRVKCLLYDEKVLHLLHLLQNMEPCGFGDGEHHKPSSPSDGVVEQGMENMENMGEHPVRPRVGMNKGFGEHEEDGEDVFIDQSDDEPPPNEWGDLDDIPVSDDNGKDELWI